MRSRSPALRRASFHRRRPIVAPQALDCDRVVWSPAAPQKDPHGGTVSGTPERDVLVVDVDDRPGDDGEVARRVGDAGVNIEPAYTTFGAVRLALGVDDLDKARAAVYAARLPAGA